MYQRGKHCSGKALPEAGGYPSMRPTSSRYCETAASKPQCYSWVMLLPESLQAHALAHPRAVAPQGAGRD